MPELKEEAENLGLPVNGDETEEELGQMIEAAKVMDSVKPDAEPVIEIITTAIGAFPVDGILPVGTRRAVPVSAFSAAWMKPATKRDAAALAKAKKQGA